MEGNLDKLFTKKERELFEKLNDRQKQYVLLRGKGYSKSDAYRYAGFMSKRAGQDASKLENIYHPEIAELVKVLQGKRVLDEVTNEGTKTSKKIDSLAHESNIEAQIMTIAEDISNTVEGLTGEDAKRLSFYRQIANGIIKTVKVTKTYDKDGNITGSKREEVCDIETRIKARKEIDRILGIRDVLELGQITGNNINITIVDASKKETDEVDNQILGEIVTDVNEQEG